MKAFKQQVEISFDKGCLNYDSYSKLQKDVLNELLYFFFDELGYNKTEKSLLELGSGTGESFKMLSKKIFFKKIHLIDISRKMIEKSKLKILDKRVSFDQRDFDSFNNFEDFDFIFSNMSIHWSKDILKLFRKIVERIKKNAFLVISFPNSKCFNNLENYQRKYLNNFPDARDLIKTLDNRKFLFKHKEKVHKQKFENFFYFLKNLKLIGANVSNKDTKNSSGIFGIRRDKKRINVCFNISYLFLKKIRN